MADAPQSQAQPKKMAAFGKWTKEHPVITAAAALFLFAVLYASFVGVPAPNPGVMNNGNMSALPPKGNPLGAVQQQSPRTIATAPITDSSPGVVKIVTQHPFTENVAQYRCHIENGAIVRDPDDGGTGWCHD